VLPLLADRFLRARPVLAPLAAVSREPGMERGRSDFAGSRDAASRVGDTTGPGPSTDSETGGSSGGDAGHPRMPKRGASGRERGRRGGRLSTRYARLLGRVLRRRLAVLVAAGAAIALGAGLVRVLS